MNESIKTVKEGVSSLLGEAMKAAGDDPNIKAAGANLAQTALTVTKAINNILLPIAAVNYGFEKARTYFVNRFPDDFSAKIKAIPQEQIIEPKPSIAGPALQGLAFTHEEPNLKEMYLTLLASAMDIRTADDAHPAFVEIIKQLTPQEAVLIGGLLQLQHMTPIVEIYKITVGETGYQTLARHLINITDSETALAVENHRIPEMIDNWVRLGLAEVDYSRGLVNDEAYSWVEQRPEYIRLRKEVESGGAKIKFQKGIITRTAFGLQFGRAVGLSEPENNGPK